MAKKGWDQYFIEIAQAVASRSTCPRLSVGAVLVRDRQILATGYNGAPRGLPECLDVGCLIRNYSCKRTIHAEANAILWAGLDKCQGATIYVSHGPPCLGCANMIAQAGIQRVVYSERYTVDAEAIEVLKRAGISLEQYEYGGRMNLGKIFH